MATTPTAHDGSGTLDHRQRLALLLPTVEVHPIAGDMETGWEFPVCARLACNREIGDGEPVLYLKGQPVHAVCFAECVSQQDVDDAWLTIASQVMQRPSMFRATDVKAVLQNLLRILAAERAQRTDS